MSTLNPQRTLDELKELRALTADENGAQRIAWTDTWAKARAWLRTKMEQLPVKIETDEAGNVWTTLKGTSEKEVIIGGHMDSVTNGGWLDGCLNVLAGLEVMRRVASEGTPPVTLRLVDWADEEGSRFGRSLLGSSACSGTLIPDEVRDLTDKDGIRLEDALANFDVNLDMATQSHQQLKNAKAYLELHIEQGPVLESMDLPLGVVLGTVGVERHAIRFVGQEAHSGSTPMDKRRDALGGVSKLHLDIRQIAKAHKGVGTVGRVVTRPGIVTAVVGQADMTLDQRHLDAGELAAMLNEAKAASERIADEENIEVSWSKLWQIQPLPFHPHLIELCDEAIKETAGVSHRLPSGPLHDAAEMVRADIPTVMMFVQSLRGISHNKIEDTKEEHIMQSVEAMDKLATKTMNWIANS
ncbi:MAG: hydantoinase/carbamoylase family amidase [Anaerolineaceae bacterium]|nr:hydantoinase/carbamoylase family amidase [Anaerolineaceae bacterium]